METEIEREQTPVAPRQEGRAAELLKKTNWDPTLPKHETIETPVKKKKKISLLQKVILATVVVAAALGGAHFAYNAIHFVETDDAQVTAHTATLSARISGTVMEVPVDENQSVKAGDLLVRIDDRDSKNSLTQSAGDLESLFARQREAAINLKRTKALIQSDAATKQDLDDAQSTYLDLTKKLSALVAQVDQAKLNLSYNEVRAPVDGRVGRKSVEQGMYVNAGQALMSFVENTERWVTANFKETQLRSMRKGQPVEITIDAIAGKTFEGRVESFAPGSGSIFALIAPDNATGNFTKIVQRVPVKIIFNPESIKGFEDRVVPGLSAVVSVRIK